jgi:hypothetical protein
MKKIGEYTTRGSIRTDNSVNRIILFDGRFDTAYKITEFVIGHHDVDQTNHRVFNAKLMTDETAGVGINWNWDNNEEIAWATITSDANSTISPTSFNLVDPDNLVVEDLYIIADEGTGNDIKMNYYIRMEKYDITDSQGALAMVRNRSQA